MRIRDTSSRGHCTTFCLFGRVRNIMMCIMNGSLAIIRAASDGGIMCSIQSPGRRRPRREERGGWQRSGEKGKRWREMTCQSMNCEKKLPTRLFAKSENLHEGTTTVFALDSSRSRGFALPTAAAYRRRSHPFPLIQKAPNGQITTIDTTPQS